METPALRAVAIYDTPQFTGYSVTNRSAKTAASGFNFVVRHFLSPLNSIELLTFLETNGLINSEMFIF
jgi:hypothetical protein